jgi:multidrug transporter EmrE-like cation transporter
MSAFAPILGWLACFATLNVLVKRLSYSVSDGTLLESLAAMMKSPLLYLAGMLYVACALLYFFSLARWPLSTAGPVFMVLGVVTTGVLGFSVFDEPVGLAKLAGILVCLAGTGLIFYGSA